MKTQRVRQTAVKYTQKSKQTTNVFIHTHTQCTYVCMYDCLRSESEAASHSSPPQLKGVRVVSACARACVLTDVVHAHKSAQTKNRYVHTHQCSIHTTVLSPKEKERDKHACMHMHVCMHVSTAALPHLKGVRVCTTCASVCAATISLIHPLCLSVCLYVYVRVS